MAFSANDYCRFCKCCFKVKFGVPSINPGKQGYLSFENLFKPSRRKDSLGIVLANICKVVVGIELVQDVSTYSDRCCNPCARKLRNLGQLFEFFKSKAVHNSTPSKNKEGGKRLLDTPERSSPSWRSSKTLRSKSPRAKKSLSSQYKLTVEDDASLANNGVADISAHLNVDDLPNDGLQIKVVVRSANGNIVVRIPRDEASKTVVKQIAYKNWNGASKSLLRHPEMNLELSAAIGKRIASEFDEYIKTGSILELKEPDEIAGFSNKILINEVKVFCPLWFQAVLGASGLKENDLKDPGKNVNAAALATAALVRVRNSALSAFHYRISTILFHSGTRYEDLIRLNRLGVSMSPDAVVRLQKKMGDSLECKVQIWKKAIEENRCTLALCEAVKEKQGSTISEEEDASVHALLPSQEAIFLNLSRDNLRDYPTFTEESYNLLLKMMNEEQEKGIEKIPYSSDCLDSVISRLQTARLPLYKLVGDNIDHEINARIQTKENTNRSIHWTHLYSILDKVQDPNLSRKGSQKPTSDIQFVELLPDQQVQEHLLQNFAVMVSRIITKYLRHFQPLQNVVVRHVPHQFQKEMAMKSNICCLGMEFLNPNVSGDMAELLIHNQKKFVPCLHKDDGSKILFQTIPLHGDQLFEERSRNVIWTYQDGETPYERLEGIDTEFADWHAKYTLYKMEYKIFVNHSSVGEIGTTRASINRTGKTNAAKGVEDHYNEYSEFHAREIEAHICASFMEMLGMENVDAKPNLVLPDETVSHDTKAKWLLEVCKQHVEKFVFDRSEIVGLVNKTSGLDAALKQSRLQCRGEGCDASFVYHSGRVRHETQEHNLVFDNGTERDDYGYYYCRVRCGEVFKTPTTRNRHEQRKHSHEVPADEPAPSNENKLADYKFNYHSAKISFGLILFEVADAIKEGDGERLFEVYKLALLLYHNYGHYKYAYAVLMYLVKCVSILPPAQALSLKWNRFYNGTGKRGKNIPLDLKKEQQNRILKTMWRALGANLDEKNAERTAGALESMEIIYESVDRDCVKDNYSSNRKLTGEEDAVNQIIQDLIENKSFKIIPGREYPSFPKFERSLLHGLDHRDLHRWIKEHVDLWGTIFGNKD